MAHRDSNQGFAFVYVDIKKLLKGESSDKDLDFHRPLNIGANTQSINIPKPQSGSKMADPQITKITAKPIGKQSPAAVQQIRQNLDRLQVLHHKLHAMLEELNKATKKKKD